MFESPARNFTPGPPSTSTSTINSIHTTEFKRSRTGRITPGASHADPVDLSNEEPDDLAHAVQAAYPVSSSSVTPHLRLPIVRAAVDLTEDEDKLSDHPIDDEHRYDALVQEVTVIELESGNQSRNTLSNEQPIGDAILIGKAKCTPGKTVEFVDGTLMRISTITKDRDQRIFLIGKLFVRQNSYGAKVPKRRNELVWIGVARKEAHNSNVLRNRHLIMTNRSYPEVSTWSHRASWREADKDVVLGPLFCRWKRTCRQNTSRIDYESWQFLSENEADPGIETRVSPGAKRFEFRKRASPAGGSFIEQRPFINIDNGTVEYELISQKYTFGDAFCGAGGASCGAKLAGLRNKWSFDYDPKAVATYRLNFPEADCYELPVHDFIGLAKADYDRYRVDILHISPPCQPFSPAHTVPSQEQDEMNQAALFSVGELVESVRPRIVTIEETAGLVTRHGEWFAALIHIFIRIGYSVTWKIIKCGDYGIPQLTRQRLMIIAAGPGDDLPEFPAATHAVEPTHRLRKIPTIGDRISNLEGCSDHDTSVLRKQPQPPFPMDTYAYTLTCNSGVGNYHPSGVRNYTVRELACLQTFPRHFLFANVGKTAQRRQIGNAVPPDFAQTVFEAIIRSLARSDELL